jgi:hypothetical protein
LAKFLGLADDARWPSAIAKLTAKQRATYERMANVCIELDLWQAGLAPKPENVIVCLPRGHNR